MSNMKAQVKDTAHFTKNRFENGYRFDVGFESANADYAHFKTEIEMLEWFEKHGIEVSMEDDCIIAAIWVDGEDCFGKYSID